MVVADIGAQFTVQHVLYISHSLGNCRDLREICRTHVFHVQGWVCMSHKLFHVTSPLTDMQLCCMVVYLVRFPTAEHEPFIRDQALPLLLSPQPLAMHSTW